MSRACRGCILGGLVLLAVLTLGSCHYVAYQEQMQTAELPQAVWSTEHRVTFDSFVEQSRTPHTLYLYVRYNSRYAYTALPLTIELRSALGWRATTSVTLPLAEEPGIWSGEGYALRQQL